MVFMKAKPLFLKSKLQGTADITIRNNSEFENYIQTSGLTKAQCAAISANLYNPQYTTNSIYSNVSRLTMRYLHDHSVKTLSWSSKVDEKFHPIFAKLVKFFFQIQYVGQPQYAFPLIPYEDMRTILLGFSDGSMKFSAGVIYILSYSRTSDLYKVHLASTVSKLETSSSIPSSLDTVPKR